MTANVALTDTFDQWRVKTNEVVVMTQADGMNNIIKTLDTTNSTSNTTGSIITAGGVGIKKSVYIGENLTVQGNVVVDGDTTISGNLTFGDAATDQVTFTADINSNIIPNANLTFNIGNTTMYWANTYTGHLGIIQKSDSGKTGLTVAGEDVDQIAVLIDAAQTTADVVDITADAITTGKVIDITADSLTTGSGIYIDSDSSTTDTRSLATIIQNHASATGATAMTLQADAGRGLFIDTNLAAGGYSLEIDSEQTTTNVAKIAAVGTSGTTVEVSHAGVMTGKVVDITADAATTGIGINMSMDGLTTGSMMDLTSDSDSTGTRSLVKITNDHASATGVTPFHVKQDSTNIVAKFEGTTTMVIPVGTSSNRGTAVQGGIRYNSQISSFEGYSGSSWGSLGGLIDVDQDTKIIAETSAGADNDDLDFYTAGTQRMKIDETGLITVGVDGTGYDVQFFGDTAGQHLLWDQSADELVLAGDSKLSFHDAAGGENIIASADGHLEVNAGTTLDITAPTVDINAATLVQIDGAVSVGVDDTGYDVKFFGDTASKYWLWDTSADGTVLVGTHTQTGNMQLTGTLTVGVDDTGHDVKFFGDTASKYWLWDTSADGTVLVGSSTQTGNAQLTGTLTVGVDDTGHDVIFYGASASSNFHWDESVDDLILNDARLLIEQDDAERAIYINQDGASQAIYINQNGAAAGIYLDNNNTGSGIDIENTGSSGSGINVYSNINSSSSPLINIHADHGSFGAPALKITQDGAGYGLNIDQNGNQIALLIDAENTTTPVLQIEADTLTTGSILNIYSASAATDTRNLVRIWNDNASSTDTTALYVLQDSTDFALHVSKGGGAGSYVAKIESTYTGDGHNVMLVKGGANESDSKVFEVQDQNGNVDLVVLGTGLVGIGTATPQYGLEVAGATGGDMSFLRNDTSIAGNDVIGTLHFSGNDPSHRVGAQIKVSAHDDWATNDCPTYMTFHTVDDGTATIDERMRIAHNGNIGIGTTNPDGLNSSGPSLELEGAEPQITFLKTGQTQMAIGINGNIDSGSAMVFYTGGSNTRMTILSDGKVGIGTTSPTAPLTIAQSADNLGIDVYGYDDMSSKHGSLSINEVGYTQLRSHSDRGMDFKSGVSAASQFRWFNQTTQAMTLDTNGRLGVGSHTSISYPFHLNKDHAGWTNFTLNHNGDAHGIYCEINASTNGANPILQLVSWDTGTTYTSKFFVRRDGRVLQNGGGNSPQCQFQVNGASGGAYDSGAGGGIWGPDVISGGTWTGSQSWSHPGGTQEIICQHKGTYEWGYSIISLQGHHSSNSGAAWRAAHRGYGGGASHNDHTSGSWGVQTPQSNGPRGSAQYQASGGSVRVAAWHGKSNSTQGGFAMNIHNATDIP